MPNCPELCITPWERTSARSVLLRLTASFPDSRVELRNKYKCRTFRQSGEPFTECVRAILETIFELGRSKTSRIVSADTG